MRQLPPERCRLPGSTGSGQRRRALLVAIALLAVSAVGTAGCHAIFPDAGRGIDGLLVADGGLLEVTDAGGGRGRFDGPPDPVVRVTASDGVVVAVDGAGEAMTSNGSVTPRTWRKLDLPGDATSGVRLVALSPLGRDLAVVAGDPQGSSFDLVVLQVGLPTATTTRIERGLNGPPAWIGPGTVAVDVIEADGTAAIATIDAATGAVTDRAGPGTSVVASIDEAHFAFDDPATGDVLVGDRAAWQHGPPGVLARIPGPVGAGVEQLAISVSGDRLAIARRTDTGLDIEILRRRDDGSWASIRTLHRSGDGTVSIAWID